MESLPGKNWCCKKSVKAVVIYGKPHELRQKDVVSLELNPRWNSLCKRRKLEGHIRAWRGQRTDWTISNNVRDDTTIEGEVYRLGPRSGWNFPLLAKSTSFVLLSISSVLQSRENLGHSSLSELTLSCLHSSSHARHRSPADKSQEQTTCLVSFTR